MLCFYYVTSVWQERLAIAPNNTNASGRSPLDVQRQMGHTILTMTKNHYTSLNVKQLQQSHDLYSPLRAKDMGNERVSSGTGYWDIE